jgi:hypothetical protein
MSIVRNANLTFLIDGNNFLCKEYGFVPPKCDDSNIFLEDLDKWILCEIDKKGRKIEIFTVFDSGAKSCTLSSEYAKIIIAPGGVKADSVILEIAHAIRRENPGRIIRVISDEQGNEFAVLRQRGFEQYGNSYLANKIHKKLDKENMDWGEKEEYKALFGIQDEGHLDEEKKEKTSKKEKSSKKKTPKYYDHILCLDDNSLEVRLNAINALRDFPNDSVVFHLRMSLEKEQNTQARKCILEVLLWIACKYEIGQLYLRLLVETLDKILARETKVEVILPVTILRDKLIS